MHVSLAKANQIGFPIKYMGKESSFPRPRIGSLGSEHCPSQGKIALHNHDNLSTYSVQTIISRQYQPKPSQSLL